jgi:hypothetical protein
VKIPLFDITVRMGTEVTHAVSKMALECTITVQDRKVRQRLVFMDNASRSSVVGIATRVRAGRSVVRISGGARGLVFFKSSGRAVGPTQPPIKLLRGFFPRA